VIKNKPFAKKYYGAAVAGPVFREVADKLMSLEKDNPDNNLYTSVALMKKDSSAYYFAGVIQEMKTVLQTLDMPYLDSSEGKKWGRMFPVNQQPVIATATNMQDAKRVPDVKGMGLKDALYLMESRNIQVLARGTGKVSQQSIPPGTAIEKNQKLVLELN
jgi:cell division protein FtsI (penicillin-binding protein 3)